METQIVLLGPESIPRALGPNRLVCTVRADIELALDRVKGDSLWILSSAPMAGSLLKALQRTTRAVHATAQLGDMIALKSMQPEMVPFLRPYFRRLVGDTKTRWLPLPQLFEVVSGSKDAARDVFLGGVVNEELGLLSLIRGNYAQVTVPLSIFKPSGTSTPDFSKFSLDDWGYTLRFGEYEASANFVLYEVDPDYRRRMNKRRVAEDQGFGPSLKRLRIKKRVKQDEFPGITAKTIGRIERAEIDKPHAKTLNLIADRLGVSPEDIESY
jgi:hypothetical protein